MIPQREDEAAADSGGGSAAPQPDERAALRRDVLAAVVVILVSTLLIGFLWLISHEAPSAGRDPNLTPLMPVATRAPTATATSPPSATP